MISLGKSTAKATVNAPIEKVNLGEWMFTITSEEYANCASRHMSAAQGRLPSGKRVSVNVEFAAGFFMIQHYIETVSQRNRVVGISPNTPFWIDDSKYVYVQITWELKTEKIDDKVCELTCTVKAETENEEFAKKLQEAVKDIPADQTPSQLHINEETPLFAKDIELKALAGVWN